VITYKTPLSFVEWGDFICEICGGLWLQKILLKIFGDLRQVIIFAVPKTQYSVAFEAKRALYLGSFMRK
jgi:hypothetical protein